MKIAVVGGGPAGLFFARLMKRRRPDDDIDVFEQNPDDATYGFGVTLAGPARNRLRQIDTEVHDRLAEKMLFNDRQDIILNNGRAELQYSSKGGAIERLSLLRILQDACNEVGVRICHGRRIDSTDDLNEYDLIVGADGANSAIRSQHAAEFEAESKVLRNRFAWYGVNKLLKPNALVFRMFEGGCYIAHYYAYSPSMCTFVAECDGETWERRGLKSMTDAERKAVVEQVFAKELQGAPLVENKSVWRSFSAVTNRRWSVRNIVLLGDALRVAHFSIGSGTRLAMDDACALFESFARHGEDVTAALDDYAATRRRTRDLFTDATVRSFAWYENVRRLMGMNVIEFAHDFLQRTGRVNDERMQHYVPEFYQQYVQYRRQRPYETVARSTER